MYPLFLSVFNETWIFSKDFRKNTLISNFIKNLPVGTKLFNADKKRTDRQTDVHYEANIRLSQFCESAHKGYSYMMVQGTHLGSQDSS